MTMPMLVAVISLVLWFVAVKVPQVADGWFADVCRCVFFAAVLAIMLSVTGKPAF